MTEAQQQVMEEPEPAKDFVPSRDVTKEFNSLCSKLGKGEMVRSPQFELSRAISAVEFFSPKMDVGLLPPRPAPSSYDLHFATMSETDAAALVDHLWFHELLHLDGATQVQSIFTCLALDPVQLARCKKENALLHALLVHTLQFCNENHTLVARTQVCFEEDFTLNSNYGIEFEDLQPVEEQEFLGEGPLVKRLAFRALFARVGAALEACKYEEAEELIKQCRAALGEIQCTQQTENACFDQEVNLFRISPQPPKPFAPYVAGEVEKRFTNMLDDLEQVCTMRHHCTTSLVDLFTHVCWLSNRQTLNAHTRSRLFQTLIDREQRVCGLKKWEALVVDDISAGYGEPALQAVMEGLLPHTLQAVFETFRVLCFNPARQKRRLVHRVEEFGTLAQQFEIHDAKRAGMAEELEFAKKQELREQYKFPLGAWGVEWCLRFMIRFQELGAMPNKMDLVRPNDVQDHVYYLYFLYRALAAFEAHRAAVSSPQHTLLLDVKRALTMGSIQFLIGLKTAREQFDKQPAQPVFQHERIKFEHRFFDPFSTVCLPKVLSCYEIYMTYNSTVGALTAQQIFDQAEGTFKRARAACANIAAASASTSGGATADEIKGFTRLAVVNSVACATAKSNTSSGGSNAKMTLETKFENFALGHVVFVVQKQ